MKNFVIIKNISALKVEVGCLFGTLPTYLPTYLQVHAVLQSG